jgi:hypothetical protein
MTVGPKDEVITLTVYTPLTKMPLVETQYDAKTGRVSIILNDMFLEKVDTGSEATTLGASTCLRFKVKE